METDDKQVESKPKAASEQDKSQPKAAPEQVKAVPDQTEKTPKRIEQGRKLEEWNTQNKQRLSRSTQPTQPTQRTQPATQFETTDETPLKHKTKDYVHDVLLAGTILIVHVVGLVGVELYYFANLNEQPVEVSVKKRAQLESDAACGTAATSPARSFVTSQKDDVFDMYFFQKIFIYYITWILVRS